MWCCKMHLEQEHKQAGWNIVVPLFCEFHFSFDWPLAIMQKQDFMTR